MGNEHEHQLKVPGDLCLTDHEIKSTLARDRVQISYLQGFAENVSRELAMLRHYLFSGSYLYQDQKKESDKAWMKHPSVAQTSWKYSWLLQQEHFSHP